MKKVFAALVCLCMLCGLCACGSGGSQLNGLTMVSEYTRDLEGTTLNVCNWGEYISDGAEGTLNVVTAFEELTGIKVNYDNFATNESLYSKLAGGGVSYDVIIPSDYLIERLIAEDMLKPLDYSKIPNYSYILPEYKQLFFDPEAVYSVPYTVGMVGVIYNTTLVHSTPDSWAALWDPAYNGNILQFESPRDAFGSAQFLLGLDVNTTNEADWRAAADKLKEQAPLVQGYVADEIYAILEGENAIIGPYYAGDYLTMYDNNEDLGFYYPKEGTNFFYDSACVPKNAQNYDAAMMFINFLLEPDIALANAEYICYATPHAAVRENPEYSLKDSEVLYPDTLPTIASFRNLPQETLTLMNNLWTEIKGTK